MEIDWKEHIYTFMPETPTQRLMRYAPLSAFAVRESMGISDERPMPNELKPVVMQKCLEACEAWLTENADTPLGTASADYDAYNQRVLAEGGKNTFSIYAYAVTHSLQNSEFFRDVPHYILKGWVIALKGMVAAWLKEHTIPINE